MKTLLILVVLSIPLAGRAQRYAPLRFDSAALAVSISNSEEHAERDSIRRASLNAYDVSATWTRYGAPGWTEHREPQPNGTIRHYWDNDDPVYQNGALVGIFWGLAIQDSDAGFVNDYITSRWLWEPDGEGAYKATAWYLSVLH